MTTLSNGDEMTAKYWYAVLLTAMVILAAAGCGEPEEQVSSSQAAEGSHSSHSQAESVLVCIDTLSTDIAVDYGVFLVEDIAASGSGLMAILDASDATVTVIDSEGVVASKGGSGSGPGEFQWPVAVSIADNGTVAVSDFMSGVVRIYSPDLEEYTDISGFIMANPGVMYITGENSFTGMRVYFRTDNGETLVGHQTALWAGTDSEPALIYTEEMRPFDFNDFGASIIAPYPMVSNSEGTVFTAAVSTEDYVITAFTSDGETLWVTEMPFQRIEKTQEEIEIEEGLVTMRMQQSAHQTDYQADPHHFAVSALALGPEGRLWAQRPGYPGAFFDVFNTNTGEYLFSASAPDLYEKLEVTPGGILAVVPGESQALLRLELSALSPE